MTTTIKNIPAQQNASIVIEKGMLKFTAEYNGKKYYREMDIPKNRLHLFREIFEISNTDDATASEVDRSLELIESEASARKIDHLRQFLSTD